VRGLTLTIKMCAGQVGSLLPHAACRMPHVAVPAVMTGHLAPIRRGDGWPDSR